MVCTSSNVSVKSFALAAMTCMAVLALGTSGCAQSASGSGWKAQDQASLAADQATAAEAKGACPSKCKDGGAGKCSKEGKDSAAECGKKCGSGKCASADSGKKCCENGGKTSGQAAAEPSAVK